MENTIIFGQDSLVRLTVSEFRKSPWFINSYKKMLDEKFDFPICAGVEESRSIYDEELAKRFLGGSL